MVITDYRNPWSLFLSIDTRNRESGFLNFTTDRWRWHGKWVIACIVLGVVVVFSLLTHISLWRYVEWYFVLKYTKLKSPNSLNILNGFVWLNIKSNKILCQSLGSLFFFSRHNYSCIIIISHNWCCQMSIRYFSRTVGIDLPI